VLEGEIEIGLGPDVKHFTAREGTLAAAPPRVVHTFRNSSDATATFLNIHAPSMGFAEMLRARRGGRNEDEAQFDQFDPPTNGGRALTDAVFRGPGDGDRVTIGPGKATFKAEGTEADGFFSLSETVLGPGFPGPVAHSHRAMVDSFYVLEGRLSLSLGGEPVEAGPGDFSLVPPRAVHTFANRGNEPVRLLNLMAPGGFEQYLKDVAQASGGGPPDRQLMAEIASRYDFVPA
jgi:mannose-6-phosphate isomerase-like protein (cupin superfamily)